VGGMERARVQGRHGATHPVHEKAIQYDEISKTLKDPLALYECLPSSTMMVMSGQHTPFLRNGFQR